jgi:hypothetical protein
MTNPRAANILRWVIFALGATALAGISLANFADGSQGVAWAALAILVIYVSLRVFVIIVLRRARAKAAGSRPSSSRKTSVNGAFDRRYSSDR